MSVFILGMICLACCSIPEVPIKKAHRVYEITFKSNPDFNNEICLAVVKGRFLKNPSTVEYKVINDTVLYMKEMNK